MTIARTFIPKKAVLNPFARCFSPNKSSSDDFIGIINDSNHEEMCSFSENESVLDNFPPSEALDTTPNIPESSTPNISFNTDTLNISLETDMDPEVSMLEVSQGDHGMSIASVMNYISNSYTFFNYYEFGVYYFVIAVSLIMILSIIYNPVYEIDNDVPCISMRGWAEISDFLAGNFLKLPPDTGSELTLEPEVNNDLSTVSNGDSPQELLQSIRLNNVDRILVGHLNINSIRNKIEILNDIMHNRVDILLVSETKIDDSFPDSQFRLTGFDRPLILDRTESGGGLLLYIRQDITGEHIPSFLKSLNKM